MPRGWHISRALDKLLNKFNNAPVHPRRLVQVWSSTADLLQAMAPLVPPSPVSADSTRLERLWGLPPTPMWLK